MFLALLVVSNKLYRSNSINKNYTKISSSSYLGFPIQQVTDCYSITEILDGILKLLKWQLSRHNKISVLRFDIFPAKLNLDITVFNSEFIRKIRKNYGSDTKMLWVREKGKYKDRNNDGIHYHYILTIPRKTERSVPNIGKAIRKIANHYLKKQLHLSDDYIFPTELDIASSIKDNKSITSPYSSFRGFFVLDRRYITPNESKKQKVELQKKLDEDGSFEYLDISKIKVRNYNKNKAVGGVLEECIYAISYLAKLKTKEDLPIGERMFTPPSYTETNLRAGRPEDIAMLTKVVDDAFKLYVPK